MAQNPGVPESPQNSPESAQDSQESPQNSRDWILRPRTAVQRARRAQSGINRALAEIAVLTEVRREAAAEMARTMSTYQIAAELGISQPRVCQILKSRSLPDNPS
jgi:DNA-binding CsgD family transcriptional regulator